MNAQTPYAELSPDTVLAALEALDYRCDGRVLALNSYENRVYQIGLEEGDWIVAKFYRPARWSDTAIVEEHDFAIELAAQEIPVVAPLRREGHSLHHFQGFRYAVFPRRGGRWPELGNTLEREWVRALYRAYPCRRPGGRFVVRPGLSVQDLGRNARDFVLDGEWMPDYLADKVRGGHRRTPRHRRAAHGALAGSPFSAESWAIVIAGTSCDRWRPAFRLIWTIASPGRRSRTCGCCCRAM